MLHRDVKSANVKITSAGVVKLLDFGIAKRQQARGLTVDGTVIGTPEYLAPRNSLAARRRTCGRRFGRWGC